MLKRAAEDQGEGPEAKKQHAAGGKGSAAGMRADEVKNPIPRLFKQNSITIHITQRTFEEIGPGELKWVPTSQYWASMFDKFHIRQFNTYFNRCSTFSITDPKVRISNILMLQDEQTTQAGTPKDVSIFTQACYLMHYQPKGIKNWFKLGVTKDCMGSQEYLTYKPMKPTDCKLISQLVKVGDKKYTDFETLVINPAKADFYAGWSSNETMASDQDPTSINCQLLDAIGNEFNIDENPVPKNKDIYVTDCFISPRSAYLGEFSCSVKGCEPHIELNKHTTYARNLDKIMLHKYGDSFGFHINTNLEGVKLLKHDANKPFGHKFMKATKGSKKADTEVKAVFCYPSDNRPFFSRFNNFDPNGPVDANKGFNSLTHHFLTMPPIKKNDGSLIKQRCSFIMEQTCSVTFNFPETVTEDSAEDMLEQRDAVVLRPAIVSLKKTTNESPPGKDYFDPYRDKAREAVRSITNIVLPALTSAGFVARPVASRIPVPINKRWSLPTKLAELCGDIGLEPVCSDLSEILKRGIGDRPTAIDWNNIDSLIPVFAPPEPVTESEMIDGIIIPKVNYKYTLRDTQLTDNEVTNMNDVDGTAIRNINLFGFLFWDFLFYLHKNKADQIPYNRVDSELPDSVYNRESRRTTEGIANWLRPHTDAALEDMMHDTCVEKVMRIYPDRIKNMSIWARDGSDQWNKVSLADFQGLRSGVKNYPIDFNIADWISYLWRMRLWIQPKYETVSTFVGKYNDCVNKQIEDMLPRLKLTNEQAKILQDKGLLPKDAPQYVEPIDPISDEYYEYETSMFFV